MDRPQKSEVEKLINDLKAANSTINEIATSCAGKKANIKTLYGKIKERSIRKSLETIPVDDLNMSLDGININALKAANKLYLSDLDGMSKQNIIGIRGIGEVMADKICQALAQSKENLTAGYRFKLEPDDLKLADTIELLTNVYFLISNSSLPDEAVQVSNIGRGKINEYAVEASKLNRGIWLFTKRRDKEKRLEAFSELCNIRDSGFIERVAEIKASYDKVQSEANATNAIASYKSNTAPFFVIIEKLCGATSIKTDEDVFGLPTELVNKINAFQLNTSNMIATLRNYQEFGTKYILNQQRVLLGDEMGLGKTMQAIASIAHLKAAGRTHFVVVCPVSVMVNWGREIEKHSKLQTMRIHGADREKEFDEFIANGGVAITTFETIVRLPLEKLTHIDMLTVDEAHYVKNPSAKRTVALKTVASVSDYILFMTGTPLENKVEEMIFLISMLRENLATELGSMITINKAPEFRTKIAPVYLRRVREDVLTELPEKLETEEWCELNPSEKNVYIQALREKNSVLSRKVSYEVPVEESSKIARLIEICDDAKEDGRKIIVFSFFLGILDKVAEALGDRCFGRITGAIDSEKRQGIIDEFAKAPDGSVMLSQITAGGVGLNIQCASVVIICEPQWKPSIENQAISRCYRMGQSRSVLVHRLLSDKTVDEEITELLKMKSNVFDQYADESEIGEVQKSMDKIIENQRKLYGITDGDTEEVQAEKSNSSDNLQTVNISDDENKV